MTGRYNKFRHGFDSSKDREYVDRGFGAGDYGYGYRSTTGNKIKEPVVTKMGKPEALPFMPRKFDTELISMYDPASFELVISEKAYEKMWNYVDICPEEVGWFGTIEPIKDKDGNIQPGKFFLKDVYMVGQEVSSVETDMSVDDLSEFMQNILDSYPDEEAVEIVNSIRLWGHSHVKMGVSPSTTDNNTMSQFGQNIKDYMLRIIANKKGEFKVDLWYYEYYIIATDIPWRVATPANDALRKEIFEEMKTKVYKTRYESYWESRDRESKKTKGSKPTRLFGFGYPDEYEDDGDDFSDIIVDKLPEKSSGKKGSKK